MIQTQRNVSLFRFLLALTDEGRPENVRLPPIKSQRTEYIWSSLEVTHMAIRGDRVQNERGSTEQNGHFYLFIFHLFTAILD